MVRLSEPSLIRQRQRVYSSRRSVTQPLVVVNLKTYETAHGASAEALARAIANVETNARMVVAVSAFDLSSVVAAAPNLGGLVSTSRPGRIRLIYWLVTSCNRC